MKISSLTDIGVKREMNQDYLYSSEEAVGKLPNLFLVADGMGGHKAGEFASRFVVEAIVASVSENESEKPAQILSEAIRSANARLKEYAATHPQMQGMGTTVVAAVFDGDRLITANVGDSRLYVIGEEIKQITQDHSLVQEMVRLGELDAESARFHPDKNIITRAVGVSENVEADVFETQLSPGDIILLCTDGLSNMVEDADILRIARSEGTITERNERLVALANENGGSDNITAIMIETDTAFAE